MAIPFSAVIPAAGNSGRMGSEKALLDNGHGISFVTHLADSFGLFGCRPVVLVMNERSGISGIHGEHIITVVNRHPEWGRSWSIRLGLNQVPAGHACFIQNVDNPFLSISLLKTLAESVIHDAYSVPVCQGRAGHPVLIGDHVVDFFRGREDFPDFRQGLKRFKRIETSFQDQRILWNINTPEDYKEFLCSTGNLKNL